MLDPKPITLAVSNADGDTMTQKLAGGADIEDLAYAFRAIAFWLTYQMDTIEQYLPDPEREWAYVDEPSEHGPEGDD